MQRGSRRLERAAPLPRLLRPMELILFVAFLGLLALYGPRLSTADRLGAVGAVAGVVRPRRGARGTSHTLRQISRNAPVF